MRFRSVYLLFMCVHLGVFLKVNLYATFWTGYYIITPFYRWRNPGRFHDVTKAQQLISGGEEARVNANLTDSHALHLSPAPTASGHPFFSGRLLLPHVPVFCTHSFILTNLAFTVTHRLLKAGACQNLSRCLVSCFQGGDWGQIGEFPSMQRACHSGFGERLTLGFSIFQSITELLYQHTGVGMAGWKF